MMHVSVHLWFSQEAGEAHIQTSARMYFKIKPGIETGAERTKYSILSTD